MPTIDLGSVVGPQGAQGVQGPAGAQGVAGPNLISAATGTTLTGVLAGNGNTVGVRSVDTSPDASHTSQLITSAAVANAIANATNVKPLGNSTTLASITGSGCYYWVATSSSPPDVPFGYGFMVQLNRAATTYLQICYNTVGAIAVRQIYLGDVSPWYWVSGCPMADGVEYATAEKFNNKTVYCQMKSLNSIAANTASVLVFASNLTTAPRVIRVSAHGIYANNTNNIFSAPFDNGTQNFKASGWCYSSSGKWTVRMNLLSNVDLTDVYATAWYTKD